MVSTTHSQPSAAHGAGYANHRPSLLAQTLQQVTRAVRLWWQRHEQRQHLRRLDDRLLRDIGMDRSGAELEAAKAFWER